VRGYRLKRLLYITAYIIPAAVVWGAIGLVFGILNSFPLLVPLLAIVYALWFGMAESLGFSMFIPGSTWQVPASWIDGCPEAAQTITWGTILGPGLITRNPYAGIWLLPFMVGLGRGLLASLVVGIAIGVAHGGARALGVLSNRKYMKDTTLGHLRILGAELRWSYVDGIALLLAAGALAVYTLSLLGAHIY
jgi:hypothetical protein